MARDDVPPEDMSLFGSPPDALDAALRGESDDPAVDAVVRDLRTAYLPEETRPRSAALSAFAGTGDGVPVGAVRSRPVPAPAVDRPVPIGRRVAVGAAAFAATLTGKIVLGGAVAAAALGGLHVTEAVDVPLLPRTPQAQQVPSTVPELPDAAPDPLGALIRPPADARPDATDRAPEQIAPGSPPVPAPPVPAGPQPAGRSDDPPATTVDPADGADEGRGQSTPPPTTRPTPPTTAAPPVPTTRQPGGQAPAEPGPRDSSGQAPAGTGTAPGPDRPTGADQEPPAPASEQQRTPARP